MTIKNRSRSTTSTHTASPTPPKANELVKKARLALTRSATTPKTNGPPPRTTQEQIAMTIAATKARAILDELIECKTRLERDRLRRFHARHFRSRGVTTSRGGLVTFPVQPCVTNIDHELLVKQVTCAVMDFVKALEERTDLYTAGCWEEIYPIGWRNGFMWTGESNLDSPIVPLIVGLKVSSMTLELNYDGDRTCVPDDGQLSPLERAFAAQVPEAWEQWKAKQARKNTGT